MGTFNQVILVGRLGGDPEVRYTGSGTAVGNFSVATNDNPKEPKKPTWHNVVVWGKTAENCKEYLKKGHQVQVVGRLTNESYEDKDGNNRRVTKVTANIVNFLESRNGNGGSNKPKTEDTPDTSAGDDVDESTLF